MVEIPDEEHDHPAFPQPVDRNALIWRYQDFVRFVALVETGRLYMRRADLFDKDQFEGTTPEGEVEYWKQRADNAATPEERANIIHSREQLAEYAELPGINMMYRITHKRHFFRDEQEVRAVVCCECPADVKAQLIEPNMMPDSCGYAPPVNVRELVEGVILYPGSTPDFAARVVAFCATHDLPAPVASAMSSRPRF
jgi:hypothetical protein